LYQDQNWICKKLWIKNPQKTMDQFGNPGWYFMALDETMLQLNAIVAKLVMDLGKAHRGNKSAAQRVRVSTLDLEKLGKQYRKESVAAEKRTRPKKRFLFRRKLRKSRSRSS
jgi:hypothetical protein